MDPSDYIDPEELLLRKRSQLVESLAAMRRAEKADVVLICGDRKFYVHKLILEASSDYFFKMMNSGLQESKTGSIILKEMDCETVDIILDFLYLGQVDKIKTEVQKKNVLKAAHLMQIQELFLYCYNTLILNITVDNFFELCELGNIYELDSYLSKLFKFFIVNSKEILSSKAFLMLSSDKLMDLVNLLKSRNILLDSLLLHFVSWLQYDLDNRRELGVTIIEIFDFRLVSKECIQSLLMSKDLQSVPMELTSKFKELSLSVFLSDNTMFEDLHLGEELPRATTRLVLFSTLCNEYVFNPLDNTHFVARQVTRYCFQELDLVTMSWLPVQDTKASFCLNVLCEHKLKWYVVGDDQIEMYEMQTRKYVECDTLETAKNRSICFFRDHVYIFGGHAPGTNVPSSSISYSKPGSKEWTKANSLPFGALHRTVLTSSHHIYVLDILNSQELRIQFTSAPEKNKSWEVLYVSTGGGSLTPKSFYIFENTIQALYFYGRNAIHLAYNHSKKEMQAKTIGEHPVNAQKVTRVCQCFVDQSPLLYVSTTDGSHAVPNFTLDLKTGQWNELTTVAGICDLPSCSNSLVVTYK